MSRGDVDLVAAVRQELASLIPERRCCRRAELDALADSGRRADIAVARTIHRLAANPDDAVRRRGASRGANPPGSAARSAAAVERAARRTGASHCRRAVLRGRFLARGSLSFASGRVHLELVVPPAEGDAIERMLTRESLGGARRERRGRALFVWKSAAGVLRLLRVLGGGPSVAAFEARAVGRTVRGALNREVNAETANLRRAVGAGLRQSKMLRRLVEAGAIDADSPRGRIAAARLEDPSASLAEIARAQGMSRSSVQRLLAAMEREAERLAGTTAPRPLS